jgi:hypothetical protein
MTTTTMAEITTTTSKELQTIAEPTAKATTFVPTKQNLNNQPSNKQQLTKTQQTTTLTQPTMTMMITTILSII